MPKIVEVQGLGNVEFPDTMDDAAIGAALVKQTAAPSPRQKLVGAVSRFVPSIPGQSEDERQAAVGGAVGMGVGMTMPNPVSLVKSLLPRSVGAAGEAADPVLEQIKRVNSAPGTGEATTTRLPALPKALDWVLPGKVSKVYNLLRSATQRTASTPGNPYPSEAQIPTFSPPSASVLPQATKQIDPALQAAAEASRARVLSRIQPAIEPPGAAAEAVPIATTTSPAPTTEPAAAPPAVSKAEQVLKAPPAPRTTAQAFELAGRGRKVAELAKAIDANAGAHLGVNPLDPRFAEALGDLPPEWWEGMAQVAKINKPSAETVKEAIAFFRDRAAQGMNAAAQ